MARNTTKTYILIDANGKPAAGELQRVEDAAKDVDNELDDVADPGRFEGMKAGISGVGGALGKLAGPAAVGAVAAGALKMASGFADVATEAGTMATALDVSVEDASRFNAAFGRVGLEMNDTVDIALQISDALSDDAALADELGFSVGQVIEPVEALKAGIDNWQLLEARDRVRLFGEEGVRQVSRLVSEGQTFEEILAEVSGGQIISEEQLAQAQEFQATMADLSAVLQTITIEIGGPLAGAIATAFDPDVWAGFKREGEDASDAMLSAWEEVQAQAREAAIETQEAWDAARIASTESALAARAAAKDTQNAWDANRRAADRAAAAYGDLGRAGVGAMKDVYRESTALTNKIEADQAWIRLKQQFNDVEEAAVAFDVAAEGTQEAEEAGLAYQSQLASLQLAVAAYGQEFTDLDDEKLTEIILNTPNLADTENAINQATRDRTLRVTLRAIGTNFDPNFEDRPGGFSRSSSSTVNNINVTMPRTANPRELTATLDTWKRANG